MVKRPIAELITTLHAAGVTLWVENGQLRSRAPQGGITADLRAQIQAAKAELIVLIGQAQDHAPQAPIQPAVRPTCIPLSFAQQRLWLLDQMGSGAAYNMFVALQLTGSLDGAALQATLNEILRRHESLRTTFVQEADAVYQVIQPVLPLPLTVVDLCALPPDEQHRRVTQHAHQAAQHPFDLGQDVLLRAQLLQLNSTHHVLLLTLHHIAGDGWSVGVLIHELTDHYTAFAQGQPSPLPALPLQYADFALWQRTYLQGARLDEQLIYWKQQLAGAPPLLQLPQAALRPAMQTFAGEWVTCHIAAPLTQRLRQVSLQAGATLFMTLLAAFQTLLYRYTNQEDIVIGAPIANRQRQELEGLIGFFVNTLALRTRLTGNLTFLELLAQVRQTTEAAYDHQDLPFERLVEELQPERTLAYNPLVQIVFALQNAPMNDLTLPGLQVERLNLKADTVRLDIEVHFWERAGGLDGFWVFNRDLYDTTAIERMVGHFQTLLESIATNPQVCIAEAPLLTAAERQQLLVEWNNTQSLYPHDQGIHQLFEQQVMRTPNAVAVIAPTADFGEQTLTYQNLNMRANQLAHCLRRLGVVANDLVGLCLERSPDMIVTVLAILKAGAGYVPFDPGYPTERLAYMLENANIRLLVTTEALRTKLTWLGNVPCFSHWTQLDTQPTENPDNCATPETVIYCLYTSGSTGLPKGVVMPHRAISNLIQWQLGYTTVTQQTRTLQFSPLSFDVSCQEIFATLCAGGTLVLIDEETRRDPEALLHYLETTTVARLYVPFVALQQLAEAAAGRLPTPLSEINTAGEQLRITPAIANCFRHTACRLQNHYGPTEAHVVTALQLPTNVDEWPTLPSIGRPIANTQIYILDQAMQPLPIGVAGELYIGGVALAHGYHQRPDLTGERFVTNPFGKGKLYRSGDVCRWLADGNIEYIGRIDHQVKLRGFRIELGEIEAVLTMHPDVQESAVVVREETPGQKQLVAYVVARNGEQMAQPGQAMQMLSRHLQTRLPTYMQPTYFILLDALPLTPNGKVDRKALPSPTPLHRLQSTDFIPPTTPTEQTIAQIWSEVLAIAQIGKYDNFFQIGGHSLLATQVNARLRQSFPIELPLRTLFEEPTIAGLATQVNEQLYAKLAELSDEEALDLVNQMNTVYA